jgi:4,5-dihydroxyphthalate decarboxylase
VQDTALTTVIPSDPWTRAIEDGRVRLPGHTWSVNSGVHNAPDRFTLMRETPVDVGENNVRRLIGDHLRGVPPTAIPIFFGREYMQRNLVVREDSPLREPRDLIGKRVASHLSLRSATGAGVLMVLEEAWGLPIQEVEWLLGDPTAVERNPLGLRLGRGPKEGDGKWQLLVDGQIDALMETTGGRYESLYGPDRVTRACARYHLRPLIADDRVIVDAALRSGLYPATDVVVVRRELVDERPDLPAQLLAAFSEANALASEYRDAESEAHARREIELQGRDPHTYGLDVDVRRNLAAHIRFLHRIGAVDAYVEPEELFIPSTIG